MQAVFHTKKQRPQSRKMLCPFLGWSDRMICSIASNKGTKAVSSNGAVKGIGGHASHNKKALHNASK